MIIKVNSKFVSFGKPPLGDFHSKMFPILTARVHFSKMLQSSSRTRDVHQSPVISGQERLDQNPFNTVNDRLSTATQISAALLPKIT